MNYSKCVEKLESSRYFNLLLFHDFILQFLIVVVHVLIRTVQAHVHCMELSIYFYRRFPINELNILRKLEYAGSSILEF